MVEKFIHYVSNSFAMFARKKITIIEHSATKCWGNCPHLSNWDIFFFIYLEHVDWHVSRWNTCQHTLFWWTFQEDSIKYRNFFFMPNTMRFFIHFFFTPQFFVFYLAEKLVFQQIENTWIHWAPLYLNAEKHLRFH